LDLKEENIIDLSQLEKTAGDRPIIYDYDSFSDENLMVIFVGERPKDFNDEHPKADLLSKMIMAMKLREGEFARIFLSKDSEMAKAEWHRTLQLLEGRMQLCIVSLGAKACNTVLGSRERLSKIHGQEFHFQLLGKANNVDLTIFPVFHPDFLQINPNMKRSAWIDLQKVMGHLGLN
jgi:uracil-DNA glycosylase